MFDVGALRATIELAGEQMFTASVKRAEAAMRDLDSSNTKAASSLSKTEKSTSGLGVTAAKTATEAKALSTQAAALDKSLDKVDSSSEAAAKGVKKAGDESQNSSKKTDDYTVSLTKMGSKSKEAFNSVGVGAVGMGAALAAGIGVAVVQYVEFDKAMSSVNASISANGAQMDQLRQKALDLGASTSFSATEAAQGETELAKAGVSVSSILNGGLKGSLALAAAGQISVADAAETAATAMTQFKLSGSEIPHVADLLANGANKAQGGVGDLGQALKQSGLVAAQFGLSVDDTVGTLSAFASAGLIGSDAGTSFKTMLLSLASPSTQAAATMKQYNIQAYDAKGNFVGIAGLADNLKKSLGGVSQEQRNAALSTIFGTDAIRSANVLYNQGAAGIEKWTSAVGESGGAAKTAAELQDNLSGDLEKLGGSVSTLAISMGSAVDGPGRGFIQWLGKVVDTFGEMPAGVQKAVVYMGIATAAILLLGGTALLAVPKIVEFNAGLLALSGSGIPAVSRGAGLAIAGIRGMSTAASGAASVLVGPWGLALAAAAVGVLALQKYLKSLQATTSEYQNVIRTGTSAEDLFKVADKGTTISFLDSVTKKSKDFQSSLNTIATGNWFQKGINEGTVQLTQRLKDIGEQLATTAQTNLPAAQHGFDLLAEKTDGSKKQLSQLLDAMPAYKAALTDQATAAGKSASEHELLKLAQTQAETSTTDTAAAFNDQASAAADDSASLDTLIDNMNTLNGVNDDAISKNADYLTALQGIKGAVDQNSKATGDSIYATQGAATSLDQATAAGASNAAALAGVAQKAQDAAKAQFDLDSKTMGSKAATDKYIGTLSTQRAKFIEAATGAGFSKDAVNKLADAVFAMPSAKTVSILANTKNANDAIFALGSNLNNVTRARTVSITAVVHANTTGLPVDGSYKLPGSANGNIFGPVHAYAQGGLEDHRAQISSAGQTRIWREPETGGELYAPLAQSKRGRSREIMKQGAAMFGDHYLSDSELAAASSSGRSSAVGLVVTGTVDMGDGLHGIIRGVVVDELETQADVASKGKRK